MSLLRLYEAGVIAGLPNSVGRLHDLCDILVRASPRVRAQCSMHGTAILFIVVTLAAR